MDDIIKHYQSEFDQARQLMPDQSDKWMTEFRQKAMEHFAAHGLPTRRNEEWKYTDVSELASRFFKADLTELNGKDREERLAKLDIEAQFTMIFTNGRWLSLKAGNNSPPPGITITSLGKMLSDFPDRIQRHLARVQLNDDNVFSSLNAAFVSDGAYVRIEKNVRITHPIELVFVSVNKDDPVLSQPRNLIIIEDGASATIVERYVSGDLEADYITNAATDIVVGKNSSLEWIKLQEEGPKAYHLSTSQIRQDRDSRFVYHNVSFGGRLSRNEINVALADRGADCTLNGLYLADGRQHMDNHTRIDHLKPDCTSNELYKGILTESSRGVFNGKIMVHPQAQKTSAYQFNPNLLLSDKAEIDTKPQLEIFADDVKCSHGATVGQLDRKALFFLKSRGLSDSEARNILVYGFANDVLQKIGHEAVQQAISGRLLKKLPEELKIEENL